MIVGAVALIAISLLSACSGGANSPERVVARFLEAIGEDDILGALDQMAPSEHGFIVEPLLDGVDEAEGLGILDGVDLEKLQGIDIEFDGLAYEPEELAADLVWVAVAGEFSTTVRRSDLPLGSLVTHFLPDGWTEDDAPDADDPLPIGDDFGIAVVMEDGAWHVSLLFTIAEAARREAGEPFPTEQPFDEPAGAATPEEALERATLALFDLDLRALVDVVSPGETAAIRRYAQLFIDDWDREVSEARRDMEDAGFSYSIDEIVAGSDVTGEDAVAWVEAIPRFSIVLDIPDVGVIDVRRDDECLTVDVPPALLESLTSASIGGEFDVSQFDGVQCVDFDVPDGGADADPLEGQEELLHDFPIFGPLFERWMGTSTSLGDAGASAVQFEVEEIDGRWFVSPSRTMSRWMRALASTLDEQILVEIGDELARVAEDPSAMDRLMEDWIREVAEAGLLPTGDQGGKPYIGRELLGPYADRVNVLLVWEEDAAVVEARIESSYGSGVVTQIVAGPDLYEIFFDVFGPGATGLQPEDFPVGIVIAPQDIDTLVEIINWPEIIDMYRASDLGLESGGFSSVFDLTVGDCFDDPFLGADSIVEVPIVPCDSPHDNEVFFEFTMTETTYPGLEATLDVFDDRCVGEFEDFVGVPYLQSDLEVFAIVPTPDSWDEGDRTVLCVVYALDFSKLTGSMEGAAR